MDAVKIALYCFAGVGFWTVSASIALWIRDRSGNSGRGTHWKDNPRIKSPVDDDANWWDNLSDKDHEALGCMLHAMRPRDDRRDEECKPSS